MRCYIIYCLAAMALLGEPTIWLESFLCLPMLLCCLRPSQAHGFSSTAHNIGVSMRSLSQPLANPVSPIPLPPLLPYKVPRCDLGLHPCRLARFPPPPINSLLPS